MEEVMGGACSAHGGDEKCVLGLNNSLTIIAKRGNESEARLFSNQFPGYRICKLCLVFERNLKCSM
jgi:hypothetical protein